MRSNIVRTEGFSEFAIECGFPAEINLGKEKKRLGKKAQDTS